MVPHDVLRGIKMATIIESQSPTVTPSTGLRSGILPPISRDDPSEMNSNGSGSSNSNNNNNIYVHVSVSSYGSLVHIIMVILAVVDVTHSN